MFGDMPRKRGRLMIFLGFAPGVGKTYTMLREAQYLKKRHVDVIIGWLEENSRPETLQWAKSLETVPPLDIKYKGASFREMDVLGIARRRPYLVLVDELAHSNIAGSVHEKRYEDVEYLLDQGVNVMTTLNIQHVEGAKAAAAKITGAVVSESVPDWVLDKADEVELVDVSPEVILQRLREGKIFAPELVNRTTESLFSAPKILALRELALHYVAVEVNDRLENYRLKKGISGRVHVYQRILVCVHSPATAARLISTGNILATRMLGELLVLYVQVDPGLVDREAEFEFSSEPLSDEPTATFRRLTDRYAGVFVTAKISRKSKLAFGITRVIEEKKITQVVIGETGISRWREVLQGSIITKILDGIHNVDIYVVGNPKNPLVPDGNAAEGLLQSERSRSEAKGTIKIYIGASAGVGKTVAMLREAHELKSKGIDVAIGVIETHNRQETAEYIGDLEVVPQKKINYRGAEMKELDVTGIIARRPKVVLIDELAHTNVPGSKNQKRYQDVQEIAGAGIDVVSAVNVQHIESLNDIIESVTGVKVRETVPDTVIAGADELVMIDVTPETLRERLRNGKVYDSGKVQQALNSFFRKENLQALRELALREVAQDIEGTKSKDGKQTVLACIQPRGDHDRLIRRGFKIAQRLNADFHILHVRDDHRYSMAESQQLEMLKDLANRLGARYFEKRAMSKRLITKTMLDYISENNITMLVVGQSARTRWEEIFVGSTVNQLLRENRGQDILIVADPCRE